MKTFTAEAQAALESGRNNVAGAVEISLPQGVKFRAWSGYGPLTIGDHVYVGLGDRALAQASAGALGDAAQGVTITLSGVDPEVAASVDLLELRDAPCVVRRLIFNGAGNALLDQHVFSRGRIDTAEVSETPGGEATITINVETAAKSLGRAGGRMRSFADEQLISPGGVGFQVVSYAGEKTLYWGGKIPARAGAVANGGRVTGSGTPSFGDLQILNRE